ncbi:hypothetical protein CRUP_004335 [Coryphaenoides rupestris]|nr:hypothetical protein CRUP_004335 [Coryphaenoides rupestris]
MPMERGTPCGGAGKARRPQKGLVAGAASPSTVVVGGGGGGPGAESSPSPGPTGRTSARAGQERGRMGRKGGTRGGTRCRTPPPPTHSPSPSVRVNGGSAGGCGAGGLEPSVEYSTCPRSASDPAGARPITPTLLGYEVMEERAKFTVYKVLVRKSQDESWVVFRRYTDFSRLNDKLKEMFPGFRLSLPPKRCLAVREFLCFDDPPGPFDSLEESREQEEALLLLQETHVKNSGSVIPESLCAGAMPGSSTYVESSTTEADQDLTEEESSAPPPLPVTE